MVNTNETQVSEETWNLNLSGSWVDCVEIGFGQNIFLLYVRNATAPVGLVWGAFSSAQDESASFDILGCYVPEWARRKGVMTHLLDYIRRECKSRLMTDMGSKEGGLDFITSYGFIQSDELKIWYFPEKTAT